MTHTAHTTGIIDVGGGFRVNTEIAKVCGVSSVYLHQINGLGSSFQLSFNGKERRFVLKDTYKVISGSTGNQRGLAFPSPHDSIDHFIKSTIATYSIKPGIFIWGIGGCDLLSISRAIGIEDFKRISSSFACCFDFPDNFFLVFPSPCNRIYDKNMFHGSSSTMYAIKFLSPGSKGRRRPGKDRDEAMPRCAILPMRFRDRWP